VLARLQTARKRALRQLRRRVLWWPVSALAPGAPSQSATLRDRAPLGLLTFQCNICSAPNVRQVSALQRETSSCDSCASTLRYRGVIHALSVSLFGKCLAIQDFPERPDIVGWGMTDWEAYAARLSKKFSYANTFYHTQPFLDITAISESDIGTLDFLISSDVFEHVSPPIMTSFANARRLLKPHGIFVLTVPYVLEGETIEHFPNLHDFVISGEGDDRTLINTTRDGNRETFSGLVFHGGAGSTLEMRVFTKESLLSNLSAAGFSQVSIFADPCFEHGVYFWEKWSLPIVARP
jgi:SAM-dependent methyltransferase